MLIAVGVVLPWLLITVGVWLVWQLIAQNGRILLRLEAIEAKLSPPVPADDSVPGLVLGTSAPEFELDDTAGGRRSLADFRGSGILLVFFEPDCGFCMEVAPYLADLPTDGTGNGPLPVIVSGGTLEQNREMAAGLGLRGPVLIQSENAVSALYRATGTPAAYLIDEQGLIASPRAEGLEAVIALIPGAAAAATGNNGKHPGGASMAWNLAQAMVAFAGDGFKTLSEDQYRARLDTCDGCDRRAGGRCLECGCYIRLKARGRAFNCPLGKWPDVQEAISTKG